MYERGFGTNNQSSYLCIILVFSVYRWEWRLWNLMLYIVEKKSAIVNMPMNLFVTTEVKRSIYDYTSLQCCNCDFIPCFLTLQFYHLVLKNKALSYSLRSWKGGEKRGPKLATSSSFTVFYSCALIPWIIFYCDFLCSDLAPCFRNAVEFGPAE